MRFQLIPHPAGSTPDLTVYVDAMGKQGQYGLLFIVLGAVDTVKWPAPATPGRADDLWQQTCFEAFIQTEAGYVEYNLSPSDEWATYRFDGYRVGQRPADETVTIEKHERHPDIVTLQALIEPPKDRFRAMGFSAVIEMVDGRLSYWAVKHPSPDRPDFHHSSSYVLPLSAMDLT